MNYIKKLAGYWFFLITAGLVVYFCISNIEYIYVRVPHIGEFKTRAAFAFLLTFMAGSVISGAWFGMDILKKTLKIRALSRRVRSLQDELQNVQTSSSKIQKLEEP